MQFIVTATDMAIRGPVANALVPRGKCDLETHGGGDSGAEEEGKGENAPMRVLLQILLRRRSSRGNKKPSSLNGEIRRTRRG